MKDIHQLRQDYNEKEDLSVENSPNCPIELFNNWYEQVLNLNLKDSNAMSLSTISPEGFPFSRFVLLKEFNKDGFVFYTNYNSQKGKHIENCNKVSLNFWWKEVERQVRVVGYANRITKDKSKKYFHSRPYESQLAAFVSDQSAYLCSRDKLSQLFKDSLQQFKNSKVPYPEFWGGYIVEPILIEFWQGRKSRLHDRLVYNYKSQQWNKVLYFP